MLMFLGYLPNCLLSAFYFSPVDCIHWTSAPQLSLLEDEMRRVERVNVSGIISVCSTLLYITAVPRFYTFGH